METPTFQNYIKELYNLERELITDIIKPIELKIHYKTKDFSIKMYTTNTILDLKLAIYNYFENNSKMAPYNQLIYFRNEGFIEPIDFRWSLPKDEGLIDPKTVQTANTYFVDSAGDKKLIEIQLYDNILLETKFVSKELYLEIFDDLMNSYEGVKPLSSKEYNGKFYPYFPYLVHNVIYPNEETEKILENKIKLYLEKNKFLRFIHSLYEKIVEGTGIEEITFEGFRLLQFIGASSKTFKNAELFFYETDVNEILQYLRLIPPGNKPILKLHLKDTIQKIPSVHDVEFLQLWHEEKSPTPKKDFILGKIALKCTILNLPYIYATIRISHDGTYDIIIEPPKGFNKLHPNNDFEAFSEDLNTGVSQLNSPSIKFNKGNFIYGLQLSSYKKAINKKVLEKRLKTFKPVFQEILPLLNEQPLVMLRYKLVDNYSSEDNISTFLTLLTNKKVLHGEYSVSEMVELVSDEFQLDIETAREKVIKWIKKKEELQQIIIGETREVTPINNSGIDIAVFQNKDFFKFHIYNVNSITHLQRIITSLNILFSFEDEDFIMTDKDIQRLEVLETADVKSNVNKEEVNYDDVDYDDLALDDLALNEKNTSSDDEDGSEERVSNIRQAISEDIISQNKDLKADRIDKPMAKRETNTISDEKGIANFYIRKLQELDKSLFEYEPKNPKDKTYVQTCAANEMRQPSVLTESQYISMKKEYAEDIDNEEVDFHEYPVPDDKKDELPSIDPDKIITVLRYGSNKKNPNYYLCSEYFCTRDEIVVLKKDFLGTSYRPKRYDSERNEIKKEREHCPFCNGELIKNRRKPGVNQTVLQRIFKPNTTKRHTWIHFLKKTPHPNGLKLPCCFIKPAPIYESQTYSDYEVVKKEKEEEEYEDLETSEPALSVIDYETTINRIQKKYIVGEIIPLEVNEGDGPQIGLVPSILSNILKQDSQSMIRKERETAQGKKLAEDAKGFLRIGVENRSRFLNDSFLSAIAPFYFKNSSYQMKIILHNVITPNIFINLNYGNLVLEFFDPSLPFINYENSREKVTDIIRQRSILNKWSNKYLRTKIIPKQNELEILRVYKSYYNFKNWLLSDDKKEYRHFSMLCAQAGLMREIGKKGITFIVLDIVKRVEGDNEYEEAIIRCPSYGFNYELMINNDIAFLMHHHSGVWEPLFYVDNSPISSQFRKPYSMLFQRANYPSWPPIVQSLANDFIKACNTRGTSIYTSQSYINSSTLIPLSMAKDVLDELSSEYDNFRMLGLLRDPYNHIVGAVIQEERENEELFATVIPIVDDGILASEKDIFFNWRSIKYENAENTVRIYNKYIVPNFQRYRKYMPTLMKIQKDTQDIIAVQLDNNLIVPTSPSKLSAKMNFETIDDFEFDKNREIVFSKRNDLKTFVKGSITDINLEEIYQHLRITFGNWLSYKTDKSILKKIKEDIFDSKLSLNDKRRFLFLLFGNTIQSWFSKDSKDSKDRSLLRKDCETITSKEKCYDKCVWTRENKCKIHNPSDTPVDIGELCMYRLFDEIIRYSIKRKELFNNTISRLVFLNEPILIGNQYVLPENTLEWYDILRNEWKEKDFEKPKFYEEMSSISDIIIAPEEDNKKIIKSLPLAVKAYLDADSPKTKALNYYEITNSPSLSPLLKEFGVRDNKINYNGVSPTFSTQERIDLAKSINMNIVQIIYLDTNVTHSTIKRSPLYSYLIILITKESSGILIKHNSTDIVNKIDVPDIILQ